MYIHAHIYMYKNLFAHFVTTYTTSKLLIPHSSNLP